MTITGCQIEKERGESMQVKGRKYLALITILALTMGLFTGYGFAAEVDNEGTLPAAELFWPEEQTKAARIERLATEEQTYEINYLLEATGEAVPGVRSITDIAPVGSIVPIEHPEIEGYQVREEQPRELVVSTDDSLNQAVVFYGPGIMASEETDLDRGNSIGDQCDEKAEEGAEIFTPAADFYYPVVLRGMENSVNSKIVWPEPGALQLFKNAEPLEGTDNRWRVYLSIEGKNVRTSSDVVLVIDKSGSMDGSKMTNTREAARAFVDQILLNDGLNRVAVVSFDKNPQVVAEFTDYTGKEDLKSRIDSLNASGATNMQGGIRQAQILLESSSADNRVMVVLGDGEPTRSYKVTGASGITLTHGFLMEPQISYDNPAITAVDYTNLVGDSSNFELWGWYRYWIPCPIHLTGHVTKFPADNGVAAIYEAGLAGAAGTDIYSIAMQAGSNGEYVLKTIQNRGYYELNSADLSALTDVFGEIAGKIAFAAREGVVIDPMGDMFNLVETDITVSQGSFTIDPVNQINWEVGNIAEGITTTLSYVVQIKDEADADTNYPVNLTTSLNYIDANGDPAVRYFPIPEVSIGGGSILVKGYLANESGQPINESGTVVESSDLAVRLYDSSYSAGPLAYNKTYAVTQQGDLASGYQYVNYVWGLDTGTQETVNVLLQSTAPTQTVWFGYHEIPAYTVTWLDEDGTLLERDEGVPRGTMPSYDGTEPSKSAAAEYTYIFAGWTPELSPVTEDAAYTATYNAAANVYTLTYAITGNYFANAEYAAETYEYGAAVTAIAVPNKIGYNFTGWSGVPETMPARDMTVTGYYSKKSSSSNGSKGGGNRTVYEPIEVPEEPAAIPLNKSEHLAYIVGYPDNTVQPAGKITREEVAAVFYRLLDPAYREAIKTTSNDFPDVGLDRWSSKHIGTLASAGIIAGYPDGSFKPGSSITRAELAKIAAKFDKLSFFVEDGFSDIEGHWANQFINSAAQKGWVSGYPDGTFKPDEAITRAEFMTLVNQVLERKVRKEDILPEARQFPDLSPDEWYYVEVQEAINSHHYERAARQDYEIWTDIYYPELDM